jgi:hypothetical protein
LQFQQYLLLTQRVAIQAITCCLSRNGGGCSSSRISVRLMRLDQCMFEIGVLLLD